MVARLQDWLLEEGVLPEATIRKAADRQTVYGGSLDTAVLEMGAMTEAALWTRLAAATGLPAPDPGLCDGLPGESPPALGAERTRLLRAVPVKTDGGALKLLCADPVAADAIRTATAEHGLTAELYVVPEVRLLAARYSVYGEPLPARYAPIWARIRGSLRPPPKPAGDRAEVAAPMVEVPSQVTALPETPALEPAPDQRFVEVETASPNEGARTPLEYFLDLSQPPAEDSANALDEEVGAQPTMAMADRSSGLVRLDVPPAPIPSVEPPPPLDVSLLDFGLAPRRDGPVDPGDAATEALCRRARDSNDKGRLLALRALRRRLTHPAVQVLLAELREIAGHDTDAARAIPAIEAIEELRDAAMVPLLIERLDGGAPDDVVEAARRALVALSAQDFGRSRRRWTSWAQTNGQRPRMYWLLDGLDHKQAEVRKAASEELRHLSGDTFGYVFDSPRRERDAARQRWISWAESLGRGPDQPSPTD